MTFTDQEIDYIRSQPLARVATVSWMPRYLRVYGDAELVERDAGDGVKTSTSSGSPDPSSGSSRPARKRRIESRGHLLRRDLTRTWHHDDVLTFIDASGVPHDLDADGALVAADDLTAATGWALKPEGLCKDDQCVPLLGRQIEHDGRIDLAAWAEALGHPFAHDEAEGVAAISTAPDDRTGELGEPAPVLELRDVDGNPVTFAGDGKHKRVLTTWASWCGCRHELAGWQALADELADQNVEIFSVALDDDPEAARPWIDAASPSIPVAVDTAFVTAERYAITNVPSVVWIDEDDKIVKAPTIAPGDDQFKEFTQVDSALHHDALRRWATSGELPESATMAATTRTEDEQRALAHRRIAAWLQRNGRTDAAKAQLALATELAPWDWTVRRGGIALTGGDPFLGEEFTTFWEKWNAEGRPGYTPT